METDRNVITIGTTINAPVETVWENWTNPEHIINWCYATDDWHAPRAANDLRSGGEFSTRMEAKDASMGFDFAGIYDEVKPHCYIEYAMGDGRKVKIDFESEDNSTQIRQSFDAENMHSAEMQRAGWQAILDTFKKYVEQSR